ncbi:type VI secretion system baseplate subunit TssF [Paraburkholderia oxyphila]|uniref:type VI secretion system baseplate subunit TssF n=1 Tax=Paraburkholderia oxyphila TaxID=614212 RepID=UPI000487D94E|nr:type VI secretion system baseplate subunit TssF [Paraburkholderia oxyphila]
MDELLPHYEYELGLLARALAEFATRYPKIAARLGIQSDHTDDQHVERLIQTFALLAARVDSRLDDDYSEFTEALLEVIHPHYLRTVPSCAIARFDPRALAGQLTQARVVPRGTPLNMRTAPVRYRSVYDVTLTPLQIQSARYMPATLAPTTAKLPADATGVVSVTLRSTAGRFPPAIPDGPVRIHLSGEPPLVVALLDALLLRASTAYVQVDQGECWTALSQVPFAPVGFSATERLLPENTVQSSAATAFHYLLEYFAFPEMFDFVDLDIGRVWRAARAPEARELTLHVVLRDTPDDAPAARALASLDEHAFKLFCTPVINLFQRRVQPIALKDEETYPIQPVPLTTHAVLDVYSVDAVYLGERTLEKADAPRATLERDACPVQVPAYHAFGHARPDAALDVYWVAFRNREAGPGVLSQMTLSLVGLDGHPAQPDLPQLDVVTTATNRGLPARLPIGNPSGDLLLDGNALDCPIQLITQPTQPAELPRGKGALWRVMSTLSPHPVDLTPNGVSSLKAFLRLHAVRSTPFAQRCIDAIIDLDYKPAVRWMSLHNPFPSFVRGVEVLISFDEAALRDVSLAVFSRVMERFIAPYGAVNSYVQLVILSAQTGQELIRSEAQPGTQPLI